MAIEIIQRPRANRACRERQKTVGINFAGVGDEHKALSIIDALGCAPDAVFGNSDHRLEWMRHASRVGAGVVGFRAALQQEPPVALCFRALNIKCAVLGELVELFKYLFKLFGRIRVSSRIVLR
jgi:hypothetical protein